MLGQRLIEQQLENCPNCTSPLLGMKLVTCTICGRVLCLLCSTPTIFAVRQHALPVFQCKNSLICGLPRI